MAGLFPDFSLGVTFDPDVLNDLVSEYENKLLASIDIENAVHNNKNISGIERENSEQAPDKNTKPRLVIGSKKKQPKVCKHVKR